MKKILFLFGTRPEAIKMAPLVLYFSKHNTEFTIRTCITAQHREMLDQVLQLFKITPEFDLNIMKPGQDLYDITSSILLRIKSVFNEFQPDLVLVHGDTTTSFVGSLAAYYQQIPVGHVEAGLRTYDIYSPFPEEINRQLTSRIAKYHFAPTQRNREALLNEGVSDENIVVTGNTVIDALLLVVNKIENNPTLLNAIKSRVSISGYDVSDRKFILVTGHRRENFGQAFLNICEALREIAHQNPDIDIVYPVHLNPNVRTPVLKLLSGINNIFLVDPMDYESFVFLMSRSYIILTDSGGIQEEAPSLGKPVLVMRNTTERQEAVEAGTVVLVGTDKSKIVSETMRLLHDEGEYGKIQKCRNPYGDGNASAHIYEYIQRVFL